MTVGLEAHGDQIWKRDLRAEGDAAKPVSQGNKGVGRMVPHQASLEEMMLPLALGFPPRGGNQRMRNRVSPCAHHPCTGLASHFKAALSCPRKEERGFM